MSLYLRVRSTEFTRLRRAFESHDRHEGNQRGAEEIEGRHVRIAGSRRRLRGRVANVLQTARIDAMIPICASQAEALVTVTGV